MLGPGNRNWIECAHVKTQRRPGINQAAVAMLRTSVLNPPIE
jgi:hypothetical protein